MKRTKLFRMMTSAALTAAMVMTMGGMTAFAEEATVSFTKTLDMTEAVDASVPNVTFEYEIAAGTATTKGGRPVLAGVIKDATHPSVGTAAYTYETTELTKDVAVDFSEVVFEEPGIYRYVITEKTTGNADITNDAEATRYLDVYVTRPEGATACSIANYELTKADGTGKNGGYTNTYKTYALDLTKTVTGDMGESNRPFEFTITFTGPENTSFALENDYDATENKTVDLGTSGSAEVKVNLPHAKSVHITGIPSTVAYTIVETANSDGYTVTNTVKTAATVDAADKTTVSTGEETTGEMTMGKVCNIVEFTNNRDAVTPTGIVMSFAPYILLVALAGVFAVLFLRKRRHEI